MVALCRTNEVDPLPSYVMRSGGGCVTYSVLKFANEENARWYTGDDALHEIRSHKCPPLENSNDLEEVFVDQHNSKRYRCLSHVDGGSYDLEDLRVTSDLKSDLLPGEELFVVEFLCAPSLKGLGTEEKLYPVRLVFQVEDGVATLLPFPYSICSCAVGICLCAHKLGMILLLHAIRGPLKDLNYEELMKRMPPNIHAVAKQCYLANHLYPMLASKEYADDLEIASDAKKNEEDEGDEEEEEDQDEEENNGDDDDENETTVTVSPLVANNLTADDDDGLNLENINRFQMGTTPLSGSLDRGKASLLDLKLNMSQWCKAIECRLSQTGVCHKVETGVAEKACEDAAKMYTDEGYLKRTELRWKRLHRCVVNNELPKSSIAWYCRDVVEVQHGGNMSDADTLSQYLITPDAYNDDPMIVENNN